MRFLVVGAGDVGQTLCEKLAAEQHDVVLIERYESKVNRFAANLDVQTVLGNGCNPDVLIRAGIHGAHYVIAVADVDEVNIATCLIAKILNPNAKRIARVREVNLEHPEVSAEDFKEYFDLLVNPDQAAADHILQLFKIPGAKEVLEFADGKIQVIGTSIAPTAPIANKRIADLREYQDRIPFVVISVVRGSKMIVPRAGDRLRIGDTVYAVTVPDKIGIFFELLGKQMHIGKSAMIWGGSALGRILAHSLEEQGAQVKLILSNANDAAEIVDQFSQTLVLHGDGTDQALLNEENVGDVDAFVAATSAEEDNVLAALLAKRLGAKTSVALVNKRAYLPLVSAIGVDVVVSSRIAAATQIVKHIHTESVIPEFSLAQGGAGFVEIEAAEGMGLLNTPLKELKVPHGVLVGGIQRRDEIIIPGGDDVIQIGDKVVLFVLRSARKRFEKMFKVKLEVFT